MQNELYWGKKINQKNSEKSTDQWLFSCGAVIYVEMVEPDSVACQLMQSPVIREPTIHVTVAPHSIPLSI